MYPDTTQNLNFETDEAVYFFTSAYDPLNNWSAHQVKIWGRIFPTLEHAYHYKKFEKGSPEIAEQILKAESAWAAMRIERQYKDKRRGDWQEIKLKIMEELFRHKVQQNDDVRTQLIATGNKKIYENSPWDKFWGYASGEGRNEMGKIIMKVRKDITNG